MTDITLTKTQLVVITTALTLGTFMNVLDTSVANVSIPVIVGDMATSVDQGTWIITSFIASTAIMLPLSGWLAKRFGEVRLFVISTLLFTVTSILCGLSTNLSMLVFFRTLQGLSAGPMIPISQSLLLAIYPPEKRGLATGLWAMSAVVAPVVGPVLGGYITDNYHWPWIFYINLPVGLFCAYFTWSILKKRKEETVKLPVDYVGLILLAIGVASLQILLDQGRSLDWYHSSTIVVLTLISVVCLALFVIWVLGAEHPIVDLSLFKHLNFTIGTVAISLGFMTYFSSVVLLPLWLQTQMNYTPTMAGLVTAPFGILPVILSPIVGKLVDKVDLRYITTVGFGAFAICSFWLAGLNTSATFNHIALIRFIQGIGIPCFFIPLIGIIFSSNISAQDYANATGLTNFLRVIGGSFGTSIFVTLWDRREAVHQNTLVQGLTTYDNRLAPTIHYLQSLGFSEKASYALVTKSIVNQSYMIALNDIFWLSGIIFTILLLFVWIARPPFTHTHVAAID